jgi:hypothetical protein
MYHVARREAGCVDVYVVVRSERGYKGSDWSSDSGCVVSERKEVCRDECGGQLKVGVKAGRLIL